MKNTLFLGNGFIKTVYKNTPSWKEIIKAFDKGEEIPITFIYETGLLQNKHADNKYKRQIIDILRNCVQKCNITYDTVILSKLGSFLEEHDIQNVITTNYDKGIEDILCDFNGYTIDWPDDVKRDTGEKIYSIRRRIKLTSDNGNTIHIWKIHGDIDNPASVSLGFDQYCGSLAKMESYIKGRYQSSSGFSCSASMINKCKNEMAELYDNISWIELFFNSNMFIASFGLDYAEVDIWWLLNKRARLIKQGVPIKNKIVYLYNSYDNGDAENDPDKSVHIRRIFENKKQILKSFDVELARIDTGDKYLPSIFSSI